MYRLHMAKRGYFGVNHRRGLTQGSQGLTTGAQGPPGFFGFGENPCKAASWEGLGGNWYTQKVPGYHTNHSPRKKSGETSWGTNPSTTLCFSGPLFGPKKGPRAFLGQDVGLGLQKCGLGPKLSKLRIEKPCRIHRSMPQTEPYVTSSGPKPFWGGGPKIGGDICTGGNPEGDTGEILKESWGNPGQNPGGKTY